jgi:oxygen-independent coproporphyrinogen III oxidase
MTEKPAWHELIHPRSAYVHVPFCKHRCGYCNFTLVAGRDDLVDKYLDCLAIELSMQLKSPRPVKTLFLGGGTPTHLSLQELRRLLGLLAHWLPLDEQAEYSVEANPLDCASDKLLLLKEFGVNRISLGGQSFNDAKLKTLERDHSGRQLIDAVCRASEIFDNVSLDLIFAAPDETLDHWQADFDQAIKLPIHHLSTYGLTIEQGANFWGRMLRGDIVELDSDLQLQMYEYAMDQAVEKGWEHYEVSSFSLPAHACRHNQAYWQGAAWWAMGPGAASFLPNSLVADSPKLNASQSSIATLDGNQQWTRATNHRSTSHYIKMIRSGRSPVHESDELDLEQMIREKLVFGLRQIQGVDLALLSQLWGGSVEPLFEPYLERYIESQWLVREQNQLKLTRQGLFISDSLWPNLLG